MLIAHEDQFLCNWKTLLLLEDMLLVDFWFNIQVIIVGRELLCEHKKLCGSLQIPAATENTYYKMFPFSSEVFYLKSPNHALLSYVGISLKLLSYHWHIWQWHQKKQLYWSVSYLVITFHMLSIEIYIYIYIYITRIIIW